MQPGQTGGPPGTTCSGRVHWQEGHHNSTSAVSGVMVLFLLGSFLSVVLIDERRKPIHTTVGVGTRGTGISCSRVNCLGVKPRGTRPAPPVESDLFAARTPPIEIGLPIWNIELFHPGGPADHCFLCSLWIGHGVRLGEQKYLRDQPNRNSMVQRVGPVHRQAPPSTSEWTRVPSEVGGVVDLWESQSTSAVPLRRCGTEVSFQFPPLFFCV